jgi:hypothetical protein
VNIIRAALADVLTGRRHLPVVGYAATDDEAKETAEIRKLLIEWLKANQQIPEAVAGKAPDSGGD